LSKARKKRHFNHKNIMQKLREAKVD